MTTPVIAPSVTAYASTRGYVTVDDYLAAPTGTDISQLIPGGTVAQNRNAIAGQILRASNAADIFCQKVLAATIDIEAGIYRITADGRITVPLPNTPIIQVNSVSIGSTPSGMVPLTDLSNSWVGLKTISVPVQSGLPAGSASVYATTTYLNGWANALLAVDTAVGATSVVLDNSLGIYAGLSLRLYDSGKDELVTVASGYVQGSTTIPLVSPLVFDHQSGRSVTCMPPGIREAVLKLTSAFIKQRGGESIVLQSINNEPDRKTIGEPGMSQDEDLAYRLLKRYQRVW